MSNLRSGLTFLFLASLAVSVAPETIEDIRAASHPLLRPLTHATGTFEKVGLEVVQAIYEPFGIEVPEAWQNTEQMLAFGLSHVKFQELLADVPDNIEEMVTANIQEGLDPTHYQTLKEQGQEETLHRDLRKRLTVIANTLLSALKYDIAVQLREHDFQRKGIELRLNKQLLNHALKMTREFLTDITRTTHINIRHQAAEFQTLINELIDKFSTEFLTQVSGVVSLLSDPSQFLAAEMAGLAASAASMSESDSIEVTKKIHELARVYHKLSKDNTAVNQFLSFCAKEYLSIGKGQEWYAGRLLHFFSQTVLTVYDQHTYPAALDLLNIFNNQYWSVPTLTPAKVRLFQRLFEEKSDDELGWLRECWAAIVLSEMPAEASFASFERFVTYMPSFQDQRQQLLQRFRRAYLFLSSSLIPIEDESVNFERIFRVVAQAVGQAQEAELEQPGYLSSALDVAYIRQSTLEPLEYFLAKILHAIIHASLSFAFSPEHEPFALTFMVRKDDDNAKDARLLAYLEHNTHLQGLLRKVVQDTTTDLPEAVQPDTVAQLAAYVWNHEFTVNDFDYGSIHSASRTQFLTLNLPAVQPINVKVVNGDFSNSGNSELIPLDAPILTPDVTDAREEVRKSLNILPSDADEDPILSGDIRVISDDS